MSSLAAGPCFLCPSPVPSGLVLLRGCYHIFHGHCIGDHLQKGGQHGQGRCPIPGCGRPATATDVLAMHVDPPQLSGMWGQNAQAKIGEVIAVIRERMAGHPMLPNTSEEEFKEVEETFVFIGDEAQLQLRGEVGTNSSDGWKKLIDLAKKASPVIAMVILGVLCWYYWPLVASVSGVLVENVSAMVYGLAGVLRKYFPEIVTAAIAFFGYFFGKKKLED